MHYDDWKLDCPPEGNALRCGTCGDLVLIEDREDGYCSDECNPEDDMHDNLPSAPADDTTCAHDDVKADPAIKSRAGREAMAGELEALMGPVLAYMKMHGLEALNAHAWSHGDRISVRGTVLHLDDAKEDGINGSLWDVDSVRSVDFSSNHRRTS